MTGFALRDATEADNAALLALTRATPMVADISLGIEREPDFFALSRMRGAFHGVVAVADGEIVGCATSARRPAFLAGGEVGEIGVIADLKVAPAWRRRGVASALLDALGAREASSPALFLGATAAGNTAVDATADHLVDPFGLRPLADVTSRQLLPVLPAGAPPPGVTLRAATEADRAPLTDLLHAFHRRYVLAPPFTDGAFDALLARSPDLALTDYRLAEREGRIVAACAAWDPHSAKRTRVVGMPWKLRLVAAASRVLPVPGLPAPGGLLKFRYLRHPCHALGEEDALRALIRSALADARRAGDHFLLFTTADGDPLASLVARWPATTYRYRLVAGVSGPAARPALDALAGLFYDDAALA